MAVNRAKVRANVQNTWPTPEEKDFLLGLIDADIAVNPLKDDEIHEQ